MEYPNNVPTLLSTSHELWYRRWSICDVDELVVDK